ncbi:MAG: PhzF family phenazine biosynthesis protein [Actinomycetota bacterium]|nr:PhzF family phenazine biosynthesis protein [Actinomycetota bacterium]
MPLPLYHVDAFTDRAFAGNPAAVVLLEAPAPDVWLAAVGAEMNLPETAFCWPTEDATWGLRWFSPTTEVPLCGHATLAAAHVLWSSGRTEDDTTIQFDTMSGALYVRHRDGLVELDLPASPAHQVDEATAAKGRRAAGAPADSAAPVRGYERKLLVDLGDAAAVRAAVPDQYLVAQLAYEGLLITGVGDDGFDYVIRFFAPKLGIAEDPVTGSAQCAAGPYWRERTGRQEFRCFQASSRRGVLAVGVDDSRVTVGGSAVTISEGMLLIDPGDRPC